MPRERRNPPPEEIYPRRWRIFAVTMIGLFMALIDVTIVNISVPELQRDLDAEVSSVSWVLNAYNIVFAVLLVAMGRLADQFGRRRFFLIGLSVFTLGSLLCALAASIDALVAFRVLQGAGAAMLAPIALATTLLVFPPEQRGLGIGMMAVVANLGAAVGPLLGGVLIDVASWHWIFLINVPFGLLAIVLTLRVMPESFDLGAGRRVDAWGMLTLGSAIFCLTYALVEGNELGWGSTTIVALLAAAALLLGVFALTQRAGKYPMLTRALVSNRQFVSSAAAFVIFGVGVMGMLFLAVLMFVNLWGYSVLEAAFAISPVAITGLIVSPIVGRRAEAVAPRVIAVPALVTMSAGLFWLSTLPAQADYLAVLPALIVAGIGLSAMFPAINIAAMGSIAGQELGLGSGIVNMSRQLGFALGVAILIAVFTGALDGPGPEAQRDAFAAGFRVAAFTVLLAVPLALMMRKRPSEVGEAVV
ncbi:MAG: MFS transporter [Thermoleophilaceae bacterium]